MITFSKYINQEDHKWYDSSNVVYSKCYDTSNSNLKTLKVVFKGGRTYVYKDVDVNDYMLFSTAKSNGEGFNKYIKKYDTYRIADTNLEELDKLRESFIEEDKEEEDKKVGDLVYNIIGCEKTGEFIIKSGNRVLFRGIEGNFSIFNLFTSLNFRYTVETTDELPSESDEHLDEIKINLDKKEDEEDKQDE